MNDKKLTAGQIDLLSRATILRRNLDAARVEKRAEGIMYCYKELAKVNDALAASGYSR